MVTMKNKKKIGIVARIRRVLDFFRCGMPENKRFSEIVGIKNV